MKIAEIKKILETVEVVKFQLPSGNFIPKHFHVTEVGVITKHFIDCGGTERFEKIANFQIWYANDTKHTLKPNKLLDIIKLAERVLGIGNLEVEVEYQDTTIGKYDLQFNGLNFELLNKQTACLAQNKCAIPIEKPKINLSSLVLQTTSCTPNGGCC